MLMAMKKKPMLAWEGKAGGRERGRDGGRIEDGYVQYLSSPAPLARWCGRDVQLGWGECRREGSTEGGSIEARNVRVGLCVCVCVCVCFERLLGEEK